MNAACIELWPAMLTLFLAGGCHAYPTRSGAGPSPDASFAVDRQEATPAVPPPADTATATSATLDAPEQPAGSASEESWGFLIEPYLFAIGIEGTIGTNLGSIPVVADFDELLDVLNFGGMLAFEVTPPGSDWTILSDLMYVDIEGTGLTQGPVGVDVNAEIEQFIGELSVACELIDDGRLEILGGARYWDVSAELSFDLPNGTQTAEGGASWIDPLVGLRSRLKLGTHFDLALRGDLGGFGVGSEFAYNLAADVGWSLSRVLELALGYRYLYVDYESEFLYDMTFAGPTLALGIWL